MATEFTLEEILAPPAKVAPVTTAKEFTLEQALAPTKWTGQPLSAGYLQKLQADANAGDVVAQDVLRTYKAATPPASTAPVVAPPAASARPPENMARLGAQQRQPAPPVVPPAVDDFDEKIARQEAKQKEFSFGEEFGKGAKGAIEYGLPSVAENLKLQGSATAFMSRKKSLDLMAKIDSGEIKSPSDLKSDPIYRELRDSGSLDISTINAYFANRNTPEVAAKIRGSVEKEFKDVSTSTANSLSVLQKYAAENKAKYGPRVEKFTDINWKDPQVVADFTNWLGNSMGAGAVQMAPVIIAAVTLKQPGLGFVSGAMGVSEAVGNRVQYIRNKVKDLPPDQQGAAIAKYVADTGDASMIVGLTSGAFDLILGPAATAAKTSIKGLMQGAKDIGKVAAMKQAAKKLPKDIGEEALTGGLQETTQIAGKKGLGEEDKRITLKNVKDVINASAAEAAGAPFGTAVNVAMAGAFTPSAKQPAAPPPATMDRKEPSMGTAPPAPPAGGKVEPTVGTGTIDTGREGPVVGEGQIDTTGKREGPPLQTTTSTPEKVVEPTLTEGEEKPTGEAIREQKIQALTERIMSRGIEEAEARAAATLRVDTEARNLRAREDAAAEEIPKYYPDIPKSQITLEEQLFREYISEGVDPTQAREMAVAEVDKRKEDARIASQQGRNIKRGKKNVAGTKPPPSGASTSVVSEPGTTEPAGGIETPARDGVVSTEQDAGVTATGEVSKPASVAEADALNVLTQTTNFPATTEGTPASVTTPTETVKAETQEQQAPAAVTETAPNTEAAANAQATDTAVAAATETKEKGKRGRKPYSEEKRTQTKEEQDKAEAIKTKADYELRKGKNGLTAMLEGALTPVDENLSFEEAETAEQGKEESKRYAVRRLLELAAIPEVRGSAVAKRIAALLNDRSKISQQEIDNAKRSILVAKQALADKENTLGTLVDVQGGTRTQSKGALESREGKERTVNPQITGQMTGAKLLSVIGKTGSWFERLLAKRLSAFIGNVRVVVLEKGQPLPEQLIDAGESPSNGWVGLFLPGLNPVIYLTGKSFGAINGQNNVAAMHEMLHAVLSGRIYAGLNGVSQGAQVFTQQLLRLMKHAKETYLKLLAEDKIPDALARRVDSTRTMNMETGRVDYALFSNPHEFLSYALTEQSVQDFLRSIPSVLLKNAAKSVATGFSDFVNSAAKVLGLGKGKDGEIELNALTDLITVTDDLLSAHVSESDLADIAEDLEAGGNLYRSEAEPEEVKPGTMSKTAYKDIRTPNKLKEDVLTAFTKVEASETAEDIAKTSAIANIAADPANFLPELNSMYDTADTFMKRVLLNFATTDFLAEEWGGSRVPALKAVNKAIQLMHGMTAQLIDGASKVSNVIWNEFKADPSIRRPTEKLALNATLAEIDPSTDRRSPEMNKLWDALPVAGKKVYVLVRDFYEDLAALHSKLLNDQIDNLSLASEVKANLLAKVKALYEVGDKIVPYFALVRRGQYWLRVGNGKDRQFYMFRTQMERDRVANQLAKNQRTKLGELQETGVFELGNDISSIRNAFSSDSPMLTELFDLIDSVNLAGLSTNDAQKVKNDIKDGVYQLYLIAMPEQKLRKQFIHREGITGFSLDMMQNFSDSASALAVQLARIKHAPEIRGAMMSARSSIANQPNLEPFVEEMSDRVDLEIPGAAKARSKLVVGGEHVANFMTRGAFIHYLSGASSALLQPLSIIQFGLPILGARYGYIATGKAFVKALNIFNQYGYSTPNADGSIEYHMPSMRNAPGLTSFERRAMEAIYGRNVGTVTLSSTLLARKKEPAEKSLSTVNNALGMTWWWGSGGALMHSAERISQEFMSKMSVQLNYQKALAEFKKTIAYKTAPNKFAAVKNWEERIFDKIIDQGVVDAHESLGNMTTENRPPIMRNFVGQALTQFLMFPLHNIILTGKNFFRMIKPLPTGTRVEAAKAFFGLMGMTILMGGTLGLGIALTMIGFISGMWDWWKEEERMLGLKDLSWRDWYKGSWLPNQIGGFIDKTAEERQATIDELSKLIAYGGLNYATGADFASRLGILNLELRNARAGRTASDTVKGWVEAMAPPAFSQYKSYLDAAHAWSLGDKQTAVEKALPASLRNLALTYELATEGAKNYEGAGLLSKDSITKGQLIWRAVGFNSDKLADAEATNFRMNTVNKKILDERTNVMEALRVADRLQNFEAYTKAKKAQADYDRKYPWTPITDEAIQEHLDAARKKRGESWRGININEKNAPYAVEAVAQSRRELARQEKEAAKGKEFTLEEVLKNTPR